MKNIIMPKVSKGANNGIANAPTFKKAKAVGKMKLPKETKLDENTVKKTKFDKTLVRKGKNRNGNPLSDETSPKMKNKKKKQGNEPSTLVPLAKSKSDSNVEIIKKSHKKSFSKPEVAPETLKVQKASKKVLPSKYVTDSVVTKAVGALQQLSEQQRKENTMFDDEANVFAQIMSIKIQSRRANIKLNLPHSTVASTGEVCLITPDLKRGRKHDHEPSVDHWEETLRSAGVTQVKTVLPMRQLRVEYDQYELKRRLLTQHDFVLVDTRILSHVSHILGKIFFKKHNMLIPVRLHNVPDIKRSIQNALKTAMLRLSEGATSSVIVGHMGMPAKDIKENILALIGELALKFPGGEHNIRSLSIKLPLSLALPLYVTLRSKRLVHVPKIRSDLPKQHQVVEGELTTMPGSIVKVTPEGTVILKKIAEAGFSDIEDEEESPKPKRKKIKKVFKEESDAEDEDGPENIPNDIDSENISENENVSGSNSDGENNSDDENGSKQPSDGGSDSE